MINYIQSQFGQKTPKIFLKDWKPHMGFLLKGDRIGLMIWGLKRVKGKGII